MHHSDADLDALEAMLTSLPDSGAGMLVSEFDGFCTGVLVCPEPISPSEWLPLVLGGEHLFPDPKAAQRAVDLVMSHYKRVDLALVPPATHYEAILETDPSTGETLWGLWISASPRLSRFAPIAGTRWKTAMIPVRCKRFRCSSSCIWWPRSTRGWMTARLPI